MNVSLSHVEALPQEFDDRVVRGSVDRRSRDSHAQRSCVDPYDLRPRRPRLDDDVDQHSVWMILKWRVVAHQSGACPEAAARAAPTIPASFLNAAGTIGARVSSR